MRINRSLQLWPIQATVHLYWRCHNREHYLSDSNIKDLYMECIEESLEYKKQKENCKIHGFCVMGNHFHQSTSYRNGSDNLSKYMHYAHSLFGARYNRKKERSGKVVEDRPKTPLIQNEYHEMKVHFYIEANPIRAGFRTLENLKNYGYSSYGFYAFGIRTRFTHFLTIPEWYISLGNTVRERQKKYRKLFIEYLNNTSKNDSTLFKKVVIGDSLWINQFVIELKRRKSSLAPPLNDLQTSSDST